LGERVVLVLGAAPAPGPAPVADVGLMGVGGVDRRGDLCPPGPAGDGESGVGDDRGIGRAPRTRTEAGNPGLTHSPVSFSSKRSGSSRPDSSETIRAIVFFSRLDSCPMVDLSSRRAHRSE